MTQTTKILLRRRLLLGLLILAGALAQNCVLPNVGFQIYFLIPLTVIAAMFEKEIPGMLFGLLAGGIWDISAATPDGLNALFLCVTGCVCGLLAKYLMRNNLLSALALCSAATVLFSVAHWLLYVLPLQAGGLFATLLRFYLPQAILTCLVSPLLYILIRAIEKKYRVPGESR